MLEKLAHWVCAETHTRQMHRRDFEVLRRYCVLLVAVFLSGVSSATGAEMPICGPVCRCSIASAERQCSAESKDFVVRSFVGGPDAYDVVRHCDAVCAQLRANVFGLHEATRWRPRCRVVLHASRQSYLRAVGAVGGQTIGSSSITLSGGRVTGRRIDLVATSEGQGLAALPHELVHVLFADAFPTTAPPKWAEEGLALLMDTADKRARHEWDLDVAIRTRSSIPLARLLADSDYPAAQQRAVFYAQSLSLVEFLTDLKSPTEFVRFVKLSMERGHNHALAAVYGLDCHQLSRRWWKHASGIQLASATTR